MKFFFEKNWSIFDCQMEHTKHYSIPSCIWMIRNVQLKRVPAPSYKTDTLHACMFFYYTKTYKIHNIIRVYLPESVSITYGFGLLSQLYGLFLYVSVMYDKLKYAIPGTK